MRVYTHNQLADALQDARTYAAQHGSAFVLNVGVIGYTVGDDWYRRYQGNLPVSFRVTKDGTIFYGER